MQSLKYLDYKEDKQQGEDDRGIAEDIAVVGADAVHEGDGGDHHERGSGAGDQPEGKNGFLHSGTGSWLRFGVTWLDFEWTGLVCRHSFE